MMGVLPITVIIKSRVPYTAKNIGQALHAKRAAGKNFYLLMLPPLKPLYMPSNRIMVATPLSEPDVEPLTTQFARREPVLPAATLALTESGQHALAWFVV